MQDAKNHDFLAGQEIENAVRKAREIDAADVAETDSVTQGCAGKIPQHAAVFIDKAVTESRLTTPEPAP